MIVSAEGYREILKFELERRVSLNPLYSLKAYSRDLKITPSHLSEIFNFKRGLSRNKASEISTILGFNPIEKDYFVTMVQSEHERSAAKRDIARVRLQKLRGTKLKNLDKDSFKLIHYWYHFAILELTKIRGFKSDPVFIAEELGITKYEVEDAIKRMISLNMLKMTRGRLRAQNSLLFKSPDNVPNISVRNYHQQIIKKAQNSVEDQTLEKRHLFATTMAIDPVKIKEAKKMIVEFHHKLNDFLTTDANKKKDVYCFSSQMFSLINRSPNEDN